jgi:D-lactate dehydrogenase (cytochrome)
LRLRREEVRASDGCFILASARDGEREVPVPCIEMPATKHAAGYYLRQDMDAVDLFVGSEGTLGIIVEAELRLVPEPPERLFTTCFLPSEASALDLVHAVREADTLRPVAIEYMGETALELLREKRRLEGASSGVPALPPEARAAVYLEFDFSGDSEFRRCCGTMEALLRRFGTSPRRTWAGLSPGDLAAMKAFRHALPEHVNSIIGARKRDVPALHKVGTDMAVPDERLKEVMSIYRDTLQAAGLQHVVFGHIGDNHVHVNILPRSEAELRQALSLYEEFARRVVAMGGSVSAEHGIGRLKRALLLIQFGPEKVRQMRRIKEALDPRGLLNPGVMF